MAVEPSQSPPGGALDKSALVVGSALIDTMTLIAPENIERVSTRNQGASYMLLEEGEKIAARAIERHVGGGGCNSAVCLSRRGWSAALAAKTGEDAAAADIRAHLAREGVDTAAMLSDDAAATGSAVLVASHERQAAMFVSRGANGRLKPRDFSDALFEGRDLLYIAPLSEGSADCLPQLVEQGRWAGAFVAANPGVRQLSSRGDAFINAIGNVSLVLLSRREAEALAPRVVERGLADAAGRSEAGRQAPPLAARGLGRNAGAVGLASFCAALRALGAQWVSISDGVDGAYLAGPDAHGGTALRHCPAAPAEAAGVAGAGDAYCATLASELSIGVSPDEAMRRAAANAASVVAQINATDGLLDAAALAAAPTPEPFLVA